MAVLITIPVLLTIVPGDQSTADTDRLEWQIAVRQHYRPGSITEEQDMETDTIATDSTGPTDLAPVGGYRSQLGYHDYHEIPGTGRCSICWLRDGDCTGSPTWTLDRPTGHYLHSTEHQPLLQISGDETTVLVHEDDYYRVQGKADEAQRHLALINAAATDTSMTPRERLERVLHHLERAGYSAAQGESIRDVLAWAASERAQA